MMPTLATLVARSAPTRASAGVLVATLVFMPACGREPADPQPMADAAHFYVALTLDHHAVTLALTPPYDTARVTATATNALGTTPPGVGAVTYASSDPAAVSVSAAGVITARAVTQGALVVATAYDSLSNVTHVDTAVVNVTATATPVTTFSIQPAPGDSAKDALFGDPCTGPKVLHPRVTDASGAPLTDVAVALHTSDATVATLGPNGVVQAKRSGHVTFTVSARAYGRTLRDSLPFVIGYTLFMLTGTSPQVLTSGEPPVMVFNDGKTPPLDTIGVGGMMIWGNVASLPIDVRFDSGGSAVTAVEPGCGFFSLLPTGAGDIAPWASVETDTTPLKEYRARRFPRPGTYDYHSTLSPSRGRIVVAAGP